jgi:bifunctional non-homologous end joining protein LigD
MRGAARSPLDYAAQLATLVTEAPAGDGWLHEQKFDGYRIGLRKDGENVSLWSRRGNDWTNEFRVVAAAGAALPARRALLDGEVAVLLPSGLTSFQSLQNRRPDTPFVYFAFDLLALDGDDLRERPIEQRKELLRELLARAGGGVLRFSDHVRGDGPAFLGQACQVGLEGVVSKRLGAPYRPGRNLDWVKTKCLHRQEFVIGGFTDPEGSREAVGSLLLGVYADGDLHWTGKVGTGPGWTGPYLRRLRTRLDSLAAKASPFTPPVSDSWLRRHAHWVRPELVAEVAFSEWTDDGHVRHPSMQGLRDDKAATDVHRERAERPPPEGPRQPHPQGAKHTPQRAKDTPPDATNGAEGARPLSSTDGRPMVANIGISHADRLVYAVPAVTKLDVARYYEAVAAWMVPHVEGRPLTLLRCGATVDPGADKGGCQMLRHGRAWGPSALRRVRIQELRKTGEYLVADTAEALVALAQMDVVELHTWNARAETPYAHDRIVIDLDPGPDVAWRAVIEAAQLVRHVLQDLKLRSWVKTTGGKGLHVIIPIQPTDVGVCLSFARTVAAAMVQHEPARYTTTWAKRGREGLILIDALRNNRTNTSVAAFSLRARAGAPVSVPIAWSELTPRLDPTTFHIGNVPSLLRVRKDPWREVWTVKQHLP